MHYSRQINDKGPRPYSDKIVSIFREKIGLASVPPKSYTTENTLETQFITHAIEHAARRILSHRQKSVNRLVERHNLIKNYKNIFSKTPGTPLNFLTNLLEELSANSGKKGSAAIEAHSIALWPALVEAWAGLGRKNNTLENRLKCYV